MKNWKTSISGLVAIIGVILPTVGIPIPVAQAVQVIGMAIWAYFSKDKDVTGV